MFDVIVAGAGPAGNIAAYRLSRMGYRVAVLDWRVDLGDKLCTGIIGRECFDRYPPQSILIHNAADSARIISPSGKSHRVVKDEPQAYIIDRVSYVASLAEQALEAGAEYRLAERVTTIARSSAGVEVQTVSSAETRQYRADIVIIATGFASPLLQMVGLERPNGVSHMIGCQAVVEADDLHEAEVYLGRSIAPGAFGWLVPLSGSEALLGVVSRHRLNGHLGRFLSDMREKGKVTTLIKGPARWGIPIRPIPRTYETRVLVAGDAAGFVKPTTGGGIYYALLSGDMAAATVHNAFEADDFSARRMGRYETEWKGVFGKELRTGYYARRLFEMLADHQIEYLVDQFLAGDMQRELIGSSDFSFDWHSRVILKALAHGELGKVIGSFGPVVAPLLSRLSGARAS